MVSIRLQRTGRRRQAQFRMVVQDSRRTPTSGRVIANLGFYNPHTKEHGVNLEKAKIYLNNGAQPSSRVIKFLVDQKVELPAWVKVSPAGSRPVKNPAKLRRNAHLVASEKEDQPAAKSDDSTEEDSASEEQKTTQDTEGQKENDNQSIKAEEEVSQPDKESKTDKK